MSIVDTGFYLTTGGEYEILKSPAGELYYAFDWTDWVGPADPIVSAEVSLSGLSETTPLALDSGPTIVDGKKVQVKLSGGAVGDRSRVNCKITTNGGEKDERSMFVLVVAR